jgi:predicted outer membrane repeat protein
MNTKVTYLFLIYLASFWFIPLFAQNTIIVTNTNDNGPGSLREAVNDSQKGDTIRFDTDLIKNGNDTIFFNSVIYLEHNLHIIGLINEDKRLVFDGNNKSTIFYYQSKNTIDYHPIPEMLYFTFDSLTITNCTRIENQNSRATINLLEGNHIFHTTVNNCTFENNHVSALTSGSYRLSTLIVTNSNFINNHASEKGISDGGAIWSPSDFTEIINCTFINNSVKKYGGAVSAGVNIFNSNETIFKNCKFLNNKSNEFGGALYVAGNIKIEDCCFSRNSSQKYGGGIFLLAGKQHKVSFTSCKLDSNYAKINGGGIYSIIQNKQNLKLLNTTLSNNITLGNGGAIFIEGYEYLNQNYPAEINLKVNSCVINNNKSKFGGGIYINSNKAKIAIDQSTFGQNQSSEDGGAIYLSKQNDSIPLGQVYLSIDKSTFYQNNSKRNGGALYIYSDTEKELENDININIIRSTFSECSSGFKGGVIFARSINNSCFLDIRNSTFYKNKANIGSEIFTLAKDSSIIKAKSSIFASFTGNNSFYSSNSTPIQSLGYNIFSDYKIKDKKYTDKLAVDSAELDLEDLALNGGITQTHMPSYNSMAYNAGQIEDKSDSQNGIISDRREIGSTETFADITYKEIYSEDCDSTFLFGKWRKESFSIIDNNNLIHYNLHLPSKSQYTMNVITCSTYPWIDGKIYRKSNNTATHILTNSQGCDSVVHLNYIKLFSSEITAFNGGLISNAQKGMLEFKDIIYQWINCETKEPILGENESSFYPPKNTFGEYCVIVHHPMIGCMDTSECRTLSTYEFEENENFNVFPNPFSSEFIIATKNVKEPYTYQISNSLGQVIHVGEINSEENKIGTESFSRGIYYLTINTEEEKEIFKLVKQ